MNDNLANPFDDQTNPPHHPDDASQDTPHHSSQNPSQDIPHDASYDDAPNTHEDPSSNSPDNPASTTPPDSQADTPADFNTGRYQHQQLSARVPEHVSRGVFSTGAIVLTTHTEFILDFLIRMARPHQVAARVVLPPPVVPQVVSALRQAIERWESHFGPIPTLNAQPPRQRPSLDEVYDELKLPDDTLSGAYANAVMISFSAAEFSFDFVTNFFPRSAVSQRVYLSVPQVPRFADALEQTWQQFQQQHGSRPDL